MLPNLCLLKREHECVWKKVLAGKVLKPYWRHFSPVKFTSKYFKIDWKKCISRKEKNPPTACWFFYLANSTLPLHLSYERNIGLEETLFLHGSFLHLCVCACVCSCPYLLGWQRRQTCTGRFRKPSPSLSLCALRKFSASEWPSPKPHYGNICLLVISLETKSLFNHLLHDNGLRMGHKCGFRCHLVSLVCSCRANTEHLVPAKCTEWIVDSLST